MRQLRLAVTATDDGGTSPAVNVTAPDLTPPNAPQNPVVNNAGDTVTGQAQPGSTVEVRAPNGDLLGTATAAADGSFSVPIAPPQTNGELLNVTATDAGGTSPPAQAQAPDSTPPDAPQTATVNGTGTEVTGLAQPGSTVEVRDPAGALLGTATAAADGSYVVPISPAQTNGQMLDVTATDAGGTSPAIQAQAPDLTPPDAPQSAVVNATGTEVTGQAQPDSTVEVSDPAGALLGTATATAAADGSYVVPISPAQTNGQMLDVTATDAGGTSPAIQAQAPDITAPDAPTDLAVSPDGSAVTGKAEPGATVEVKDPAGNTIGTGTADGNGDFIAPLAPAQTDGQMLDVIAIDSAGNPSAPAQVQAPDLPVPSAPTDLAVAPNGASVTGRAEPGSTVSIYGPDGSLLGAAQTDASGSFYAVIAPAQVKGEHLAVIASNANGTSPQAFVTAPNIEDDVLEPGVLMRAWGEFAKDRYGFAIAAGDVDGDGHVDVVVGAPHYSKPIVGTKHKLKKAGRVYVYSGRTGLLMHTFDGEVKADWFGHAVAVLDFNDDGQMHIAVGAPRADASPKMRDSGKVYIYSGDDGRLLATALGSARGERLGWSLVALPNDTDVDQLAAGAPNTKSAAGLPRAGYINVLGFDDATASKARSVLRIDGLLRQDQVGLVIAAAPDLNGDGYDGLAVGLPKAKPLNGAKGKIGVVRLYEIDYSAATSQLVVTIDGATVSANAQGALRNGDWFGHSIAQVDDMDGDGIAELLIGAPRFDPVVGGKRVNNAGAAFIASSSMFTSNAQVNWLGGYFGEVKGDQFGWAVANGGTLQTGGDVYHFISAKGVDTVIPNPKNGKTIKANNAGAIYGFKAGDTQRAFKRVGAAKKAFYGSALLAVGDVDKDGYTDVITASPFMSRYTPLTRKWLRNIGFVEVYSGEFIVNKPTP